MIIGRSPMPVINALVIHMGDLSRRKIQFRSSGAAAGAGVRPSSGIEDGLDAVGDHDAVDVVDLDVCYGADR